MSVTCSSCGAECADDARFCAQCGTQLSAPAERKARKVVSALFADVVGSTRLGEQLDPEDFTEVVGEAVRTMAECVERYGGSVSELAGDGLLALFGAPVAHEDDPERAALAGLAITAASREYAQRLERELGIAGFNVRVGIETGLAILGQMGGGTKVEYGAMGDSLNTAARLQAAADPGGVLVGPETHRLISARFECGEPRALELKGKTGTVTGHHVLGEHATHTTPVRGLTGIEAPLVGRTEDLRRAQTAIETLCGGRGGVVLIGGEAGLGKSRLLRELERLCRDAEVRWLEGRCVSYGETLPYWPLQGVIRSWLGVGPRDDFREALESACAGLPGESADTVAEALGLLLGGQDEDADDGAAGVQERLQAGFASLLRGLSYDRPLVVALDDMHWADPSSVALVERIVGLTGDVPLLLVVAARPDPAPPLRQLSQRARAGDVTEITLGALDADAERGLLSALIGAGILPARLERRLLDRAEGNPFFLEELVRSMIDAGALVEAEGGWRFEADAEVELPDSVEKVVLARVDLLPGDAQAMLSAAAVLGRQFTASVLERVLEQEPLDEGALSKLQDADLIRPGDPGSYRFRHALIREAAYHSLLKRRRQELHGRAARAIEAVYAEGLDEVVGLLALHCTEAGDDEKALDYHHRAGVAARAIHAPEEAVEHFSAALRAAQRMGQTATDRAVREVRLLRAGSNYDLAGNATMALDDATVVIEGARETGDIEHEYEGHLAMGYAYRAVDFPRATSALEEAVEIAAQRGDVPGQVDTLCRLAIYHINALALELAEASIDRASRIAEQGGGEDEQDMIRDARKLLAQQAGELDLLEELSSGLIAAYSGREHASGPREGYSAGFFRMWALLESATVSIGRGRFEEAHVRLSEAHAELLRRGSAGHESLFLEGYARLGRASGDYRMAVDHGRRAVESAGAMDMFEWGAWSAATLGWTLLDLRAGDEALALLETWSEHATTAGVAAQLVRCSCLLAQASTMTGHPEAPERMQRAEALLERIHVPEGSAWLFGAHAYFALGRALIAAGDPARALAIVEPVVAAAERTRWLENEADGALVLGLAHLRGGDLDAAGARAGRALAIASELGFACAWEAHALNSEIRRAQGRDEEADHDAAQAAELVERLAAGLGDDPLAEAFRARGLGRR